MTLQNTLRPNKIYHAGLPEMYSGNVIAQHTNTPTSTMKEHGFTKFIENCSWHCLKHFYAQYNTTCSRCQWPRGLRRRSTAALLLRSWVRIPPGARMLVYCECCVLSGRDLCDELITRAKESYRL